MPNDQDMDFKLASWRKVTVITTSALVLYYALGYGFTPQNFTFKGVTVWDIFYLAVVDQFLIEICGLFLLFKLLEFYIQKSGFRLDGENGMGEMLKLAPFFGLAYFPIVPVTLTLRYVVREGFDFDWSLLLNDYLFNPSLYIIYTIFFTASGGAAILWHYLSQKNQRRQSKEGVSSRIVGEHQAIMKPIALSEIYWIEVDDRKYWAVTADKKLKVNKTLSDFESELPGDRFIRLNRGVIVNARYIDSYATWGNGAYVVEMKPPQKREFILSRSRVRKFKQIMEG